MKTLELLPPNNTMYQALVNRDPSFEGIFFVGVRTTGIFCRPTCSAKKPARENVEFFPSPNEALVRISSLFALPTDGSSSLCTGVDQAVAGRS